MPCSWLDRLDHIGEPHPAFELAFRWLDEHRPAKSSPVAVVHGDFRLGNVIVDATGLQAVIDWELAHLGDPMEDLGWLCSPAWRFGSPLPAAGVGTREQLFAAYGEVAGVEVDPDVVRWWEVNGILRWGIICVAQAHVHTSGVVRSHELAAISHGSARPSTTCSWRSKGVGPRDGSARFSHAAAELVEAVPRVARTQRRDRCIAAQPLPCSGRHQCPRDHRA